MCSLNYTYMVNEKSRFKTFKSTTYHLYVTIQVGILGEHIDPRVLRGAIERSPVISVGGFFFLFRFRFVLCSFYCFLRFFLKKKGCISALNLNYDVSHFCYTVAMQIFNTLSNIYQGQYLRLTNLPVLS